MNINLWGPLLIMDSMVLDNDKDHNNSTESTELGRGAENFTFTAEDAVSQKEKQS